MNDRAFRIPFFSSKSYEHISQEIGRDIKELPKAQEGHLSPEQAEFLHYLVRLVKPELVVETGFGVGHSACVIMNAQKSIGINPFMMSIDICATTETKEAATLVKQKFDNFIFVEGDSKKVLLEVVNRILREYEGIKLKLGVIDGGHDYETTKNDLEIMSSFLSLGGYLWLDDFEKIIPNSGVNRSGREFAIKWGNCNRFRTSDTRGFMIYQKGF